MKSFGKLRGLHKETTRINRIIQAEFGRIEPEDWRSAPRRNILCIQTKTACSRGRLGMRILTEPRPNLAESIRRRIEPLGGVELAIPPRQVVRRPPEFAK